MNGWVNKIHMHTMEYYSLLKRKQNRKNHEDTMVSEISPSQKDKYYTIPPTGGTLATENRMVLPRGSREERMGSCCLMCSR